MSTSISLPQVILQEPRFCVVSKELEAQVLMRAQSIMLSVIVFQVMGLICIRDVLLCRVSAQIHLTERCKIGSSLTMSV